MTKEQLSEEYRWLTRNRLHPEFQREQLFTMKLSRRAKEPELKKLKN